LLRISIYFLNSHFTAPAHQHHLATYCPSCNSPNTCTVLSRRMGSTQAILAFHGLYKKRCKPPSFSHSFFIISLFFCKFLSLFLPCREATKSPLCFLLSLVQQETEEELFLPLSNQKSCRKSSQNLTCSISVSLCRSWFPATTVEQHHSFLLHKFSKEKCRPKPSKSVEKWRRNLKPFLYLSPGYL
jgi:hypothetical protein